ncbi:MAG TPA: MotA/TolQ/ExbB proton channel family protein [Cryomorphaceae bacterium]|nr:MotA/TolQ/ExbB proton channel family protein [Cryomorphaceae bacterium]
MKTPLFLQINPGAAASDSLAAAAADVETISIWQLIIDGGWYIMIPLGILSVIAIYIFAERWMAITKASKEDKDFMNRIKDYVSDGKLDAARSLCATTATPIARMLDKGVARIGKPMDDVSASIENVGKLEVYKLEKGLAVLATVAGAAPMIGFLGTVIGMIMTFHAMKISGNGVEIGALSGGIMQAMVTTVAGLIIGIIAYIAYNTLVVRVDKVVHKMEARSIEFVDLLEEPGK